MTSGCFGPGGGAVAAAIPGFDGRAWSLVGREYAMMPEGAQLSRSQAPEPLPRVEDYHKNPVRPGGFGKDCVQSH
jgi:hypothetical protein